MNRCYHAPGHTLSLIPQVTLIVSAAWSHLSSQCSSHTFPHQSLQSVPRSHSTAVTPSGSSSCCECACGCLRPVATVVLLLSRAMRPSSHTPSLACVQIHIISREARAAEFLLLEVDNRGDLLQQPFYWHVDSKQYQQ